MNKNEKQAIEKLESQYNDRQIARVTGENETLKIEFTNGGSDTINTPGVKGDFQWVPGWGVSKKG